jgi:hypothetical protein
MAFNTNEGLDGRLLSVNNARTGDVWLSDFDRGVITSLGGAVNAVGDMYVINIPGVSPPPPSGEIEFEGIPIYFAFPDETIDPKILPSFVVRRDSIDPAMSRWHPGNQQYEVPASSANEVTITNPRTGNVMARGFDSYEDKAQAVPFDLLYTIQIRARYRNNLKVESMRMLQFTLKRFPPYCTVYVRDSQNDLRSYTAFMESPAALDTKPDVAGRETNFNVSIRVEAELDLNDPVLRKAMSSLPTINYNTK